MFLFTLVGFRRRAARKSSVLSKVRCLYCSTELHPGKSFQIPEVLDSAHFCNQWWHCPWSWQRQNQDGIVSNPPGQFYKLYVVFTSFYVWLRKKNTSHTYSSWAFHMFLSWGSSEAHSLHMCKQPIQTFLKVKKSEYKACSCSKFHARPQIQVSVESCFPLIFWRNTGFSSSVELFLVFVGWTSLIC